MRNAPLCVEVFSSPGCVKCARAKAILKDLAEAIGGARISWREVDILEEIDYAVDLGVIGAPSIAIDGELVFPSLPRPAKLRAELLRRLGTAGEAR